MSTLSTSSGPLTSGRPAAVATASGTGAATWAMGALFERLVGAADTAGVLEASIVTQPPGAASPLHVHTREAEAWYLLEGTMTYVAGTQTFHLAPGDFIYLPQDVPHAFRTTGATPARFLGLTLPGGLMDLYDEVGEPASERRLPDGGVSAGDIARWNELARGYGVRVVGPPIPPTGEVHENGGRTRRRQAEEDQGRMSDGARDRRPERGRYHSPRRVEQAVATRRAVLDAARALFVSKGYLATTVADIASEARVAVDTVYATVGRKPALLREVLETAISGTDQAVPAEQRDYVARVRAAPTAGAKIEAYVAGLVELQPRLAPIYLALRDAAATDPDSAALWREISGRRAANMRSFAADLRSTGELRPDLSDEDVADVVWSMNGPEYWTLLVGDRGWTAQRFADLLVDAWRRLLLATPDGLPADA